MVVNFTTIYSSPMGSGRSNPPITQPESKEEKKTGRTSLACLKPNRERRAKLTFLISFTKALISLA